MNTYIAYIDSNLLLDRSIDFERDRKHRRGPSEGSTGTRSGATYGGRGGGVSESESKVGNL